MPRASKIEAKLSSTIVSAVGLMSVMIKATAAGTAVVTVVMTAASSPLQHKRQFVVCFKQRNDQHTRFW